MKKEKIYQSLDKYGLEIKDLDHLISSALSSNGLYSLFELERRMINVQPPFKLVEKEASQNESQDEEEYVEVDENS